MHEYCWKTSLSSKGSNKITKDLLKLGILVAKYLNGKNCTLKSPKFSITRSLCFRVIMVSKRIFLVLSIWNIWSSSSECFGVIDVPRMLLIFLPVWPQNINLKCRNKAQISWKFGKFRQPLQWCARFRSPAWGEISWTCRQGSRWDKNYNTPRKRQFDLVQPHYNS